MSEDERPKSNLIPILIGIGCLILMVVLIAASVKWGFENSIQFIGVVIILAVVGFATRKFWVAIFSSFNNTKMFVVISSITAVILYLLFLGGKLMSFVFADTTAISPAVFGVAVVAGAFFSVKFFLADFNHRTLALFLLVYSAGYAYFNQQLWLTSVAAAAICSWQWLRIYKKFTWNSGMRVTAIGLLLKQSIRLATMTVGPFVVLYMLVQDLTGWWQMGTVTLSFVSTIYLCWSCWLRRWILI